MKITNDVSSADVSSEMRPKHYVLLEVVVFGGGWKGGSSLSMISM